jgi:hypothetical protein
VRLTVIAWLGADLALVLLAGATCRSSVPAAQHPVRDPAAVPRLEMLGVPGLIAAAAALTSKRMIPDVAAGFARVRRAGQAGDADGVELG